MNIARPTSLRIVNLPDLRDQVVSRLRMAIAAGHFPPGTRLIERELCETLGVSRTSLREALRVLQSEGLITAKPNKGLMVALVSRRTARDIYQVRAVMEGLAARLFAQNATQSQMKALRDSIDRLAKVYDNFSADAFIQVKSEFYDILLEGAGNEAASEMLRRIHTRVSQLRVVSLSNADRAKKSIAELRQFIKALEARDEEKAWKICVQHVENAARAAIRALPDD